MERYCTVILGSASVEVEERGGDGLTEASAHGRSVWASDGVSTHGTRLRLNE